MFFGTEIEKNIKGLIALNYRDVEIPTPLITAYVMEKSHCYFWEIRYGSHRSANTGSIKYYPKMLVKLKSCWVDDKFSYREIQKLNLEDLKKVRRTKGNLQDFIGKKLFRTTYTIEPSKFFVNFPQYIIKDHIQELKNNQALISKIYEAFGIHICL